MKNVAFSIAVLFLLTPIVLGLSCSQIYECLPVSDDYNFVACDSGQCVCRNDLGFSGNATAQDPCSCASPASVYWGASNPYCKTCLAPQEIIYTNGIPYCVDPAACEEEENDLATQAIRRAVVEQIYNNLIYPIAPAIIAGLVPIDNLFAPDVKGRVTPAGDFDEFVLVEEYFYVLAATPGSFVQSVNIKSLLSSGDKVAVDVDILFNNSNAGTMYNLTQMGFFIFNDQNLVESLDLVILNLGAAVNPPDTPEAHSAIINEICALLVDVTCSNPVYDPEGHYTSIDDCVSFMNSIPFGTWDRANSNTVVCRQLHSLITPYRPDIHCPHTGKTGGGFCVDVTYESFYDYNYDY